MKKEPDPQDIIKRLKHLQSVKEKGLISQNTINDCTNMLIKSEYDQFDLMLSQAEVFGARQEAMDNLSKNNKNEIIKPNELTNLVRDIEKLKRELIHKDNTINKQQEENKTLKGSLQQTRIDEKIPNYVEEVKQKLNDDDGFFIKMSNRWSIFGAISCAGAIIAAFFTFNNGLNFLLNNENINKVSLFYLFIRGLLGIGLLSWLSYLCFSNARRYTHESIRRKDRQHALMFGQIFLQIYGSTASKEDAINVFKDWNMSVDSAFSGNTAQPPSIQSIITHFKEMIPSKCHKENE